MCEHSNMILASLLQKCRKYFQVAIQGECGTPFLWIWNGQEEKNALSKLQQQLPCGIFLQEKPWLVMTASNSQRLMLWLSTLTAYERTGSSVSSRIFCGKAGMFWLVCPLGCLVTRLYQTVKYMYIRQSKPEGSSEGSCPVTCSVLIGVCLIFFKDFHKWKLW